MDQVLDELHYLAEDPEAASTTLNLDKHPFDFNEALTDVHKIYDFITARRISILNKLANQ